MQINYFMIIAWRPRPYVTLEAWKKATAELFYDSTTIRDAHFSVFISRLAKWNICYLPPSL